MEANITDELWFLPPNFAVILISLLSVLRKVTRKEDRFDGNGGQGFVDHVYDNVQVRGKNPSYLILMYWQKKQVSLFCPQTYTKEPVYANMWLTDGNFLCQLADMDKNIKEMIHTLF